MSAAPTTNPQPDPSSNPTPNPNPNPTPNPHATATARLMRGACLVALLFPALLAGEAWRRGASVAALALLRETGASLALASIACTLVGMLARRLAPRRPSTAFALLALPLVVGVVRGLLAERLRGSSGATPRLLLAGLGATLALALLAHGVRALAASALSQRLVPAGARATTLGGVAACVLGAAALATSDVPRLVGARETSAMIETSATHEAPAANEVSTASDALAASEAPRASAVPTLLAELGMLARAGLSAAPRDNLLVSARALDHEVWVRGGAPVEIGRDAITAPDGTLSAERLGFPDGLSTLVQTTDVPARGARFEGRVWVRRLDGDGPSDAGLALLLRAGPKGPYGQLVVHPTEVWTEYSLEHAFGDDAGDEPVTFRIGNDHGDPRALEVAVWDARLVERAVDDR
ncbi:MAG: hypothetical protein H6825_01085 [Planctomycetes bacterium]|nr:hypothetical protein [Planctomycetota bacterium]